LALPNLLCKTINNSCLKSLYTKALSFY
jgi:hypothetical protein